jgi:hypothetical protein
LDLYLLNKMLGKPNDNSNPTKDYNHHKHDFPHYHNNSNYNPNECYSDPEKSCDNIISNNDSDWDME